MRRELATGVMSVFVAGAVLAQTLDPTGRLGATPRDLWIHPRGESYQPELHYKAPDGELYYHAENDIRGSLSDFKVESRTPLVISIGLGEQLRTRAREGGGSVRPVFLWDANGDGAVDRSMFGRIEGERAIFDPPAGLDLVHTHWQIGMRFVAGANGDATLNRRYLASVDSSAVAAQLAKDVPVLAPVASAPPPGLLIFKHRAPADFDFDAFLADPSKHAQDFDLLTKAADEDDWTIADGDGQLRGHYEQQDLYIVRATGGTSLEVIWGDLPLGQYLSENLKATPDSAGCMNTRDVALESEDGTKAVVPQRILYCPEQAMAFFELPDGYEVELAAVPPAASVPAASFASIDERIDATHGGGTTRDNLRLFAKEVHPRAPSRRATGTISGNLSASFAAAGQDLVDLGRHAVVGETRTHMHEGTTGYRASPLTMLPLAVYDLVRLRPVDAGGRIVTGVESGVATVADAVSAANNAVVTPVAQLTVGPTVSPAAADSVGDAVGVVSLTVAKNLPGSERMLDAWGPMSFVQHDRGYKPGAYTRTDTQLNIDRLVSALDAVAIGAVIHHNRGGGSDGAPGRGNDGGGGGTPGGGGGGGGGGPVTPPPGPPSGGGGGCPPPPPPKC